MTTTAGFQPVETDRNSAVEAELLGRMLEDWECCSALWIAVIERAADDLRWLRKMSEQPRLRKHEKERLKKVLENNPAEFFRSAWFRDICDQLNVSVDLIRAHYGVEELLATAA